MRSMMRWRRSESMPLVRSGVAVSEGGDARACLVIELVPESCLRLIPSVELDPREWERVRTKLFERAGNRCELCGTRARDSGLECEVLWSYDDTAGVQRLRRLLVACAACSEVLHFDLAVLAGTAERALEHLADVNRWDAATAERHVAAAYRRWEQRSRRAWRTDVEHLRDYVLEATCRGLPTDLSFQMHAHDAAHGLRLRESASSRS